MTTVLVMAGGTGGHVFPALAVARVLTERNCSVVWLGTQKGIESRLVPEAGYPIEWIHVAGLRGKGVLNWLYAPFKVLRAVAEAIAAIRRIRPDVVLGMGGFASGPGGIAARLLGCPLVIHEQNAVAGLTNRILARFACVVAEAYSGAFPQSAQALHVGNPVRSEIEQISNAQHTPSTPRHLLVFGGSQGAIVLNRVVPAALAEIPPTERPQVFHQAGRGRLEATREAYSALGVQADVQEFIGDMAAAYRWADIAITRSGALTVAELAAAGVPAVLVPFPAAVDDHQTANARYLTDRSAALLMPERELNAQSLAATILNLASADGSKLVEMRRAATSAAKLDTARILAELCLAQATRRAA